MIVRVLLACVLVAAGCATARPEPAPSETPPPMPAAPPAPGPGDAPTRPTELPLPVVAPGETPPGETPTGETPTPETPSEPTPPVPEPEALPTALAACTPATWATCRPTLEALRPRLAGPEVAAIVKDLDERAAVWASASARTIGVLLPLSGPHEKVGQAAREAIELALADRPELRLVVRDTAEEPARAAAEALRLLAEDHVVALLGPIGRKETAAVAAVARRFGVPHVALASAVDAAPADATMDPVIRVRTSAVELAEAVARQARSELGVARVAVLHPSTDLGAEAASAFSAELVRLGGAVAVTVAYAPTDGHAADDFKAALAALVRAPKPGKAAIIDFDAIFIPDQAGVVRRLVPFLQAWGVVPRTAPPPLGPPPKLPKGKKAAPRVQLLGSSGWASPAVVEKAQGLTDNAVFADVWVPEQADPTFAAGFAARFGRKPTAFHAEVYDAARFLAGPVAAGADGVDQDLRLAVGAALAAPRTLPGATGAITVVAGGRLLSRAHVMTVDGQLLRPRLSEAEERAVRAARTAPAAGGAP